MTTATSTRIVARGTLPPGEAGTSMTLELMRQVARTGSTDVNVRIAAQRIVASAGARAGDVRAQVAALYRFVRDAVRFTPDPDGIELLQTPSRLLQSRRGDCDDKAMLLASLLASLGLARGIRFRAVAASSRAPERFSHVFVVANVLGRDLVLDATLPWMRLGWQAPSFRRPLEVTL